MRPLLPGGRTWPDRVQLAYAALVLTQGAAIGLFERGLLPHGLALPVGLATSVLGPVLSLRVSLHVMRRTDHSMGTDVAWVGGSYLVTAVSFAVLHALVFEHDPHAYSLPDAAPWFGLGSALYFSCVTLTTTGYGDIAPVSALARTVAVVEIVTGLLYQVVVFSLLAALIGARATQPPAAARGHDDAA